MLYTYYFYCGAHHLLVTCIFLAGVLTVVSGCTANVQSSAIDHKKPQAPSFPEVLSVARYSRYTLVELAATANQRDLLLQVVDVSIPNTLHASVGDGLRYVLQRSGYQLCNEQSINALDALPLPAAHYQLGPMVLREALLTLVGSAWDLHVDNGSRLICFTRTIPIKNESTTSNNSTTSTDDFSSHEKEDEKP